MLTLNSNQTDQLKPTNQLWCKISRQCNVENTGSPKEKSQNIKANMKQGLQFNEIRKVPLITVDSYSKPMPKHELCESQKDKVTKARVLQPRQKCKCAQCIMCYVRKAYLIKHVLGQHGTQNSCLKCMQIFQSEQQYEKHMLIFHASFNCELCGAAFKTNFKLKHHIDTHRDSRDNLFKCSFPNCTYSNNRYTYFENHVNKHRKKKPFCCGKCKRQFCSRHIFNRHVKTCIGDFGKCPRCDIEYSSDSMLYDHIQTCHVGEIYACPKCDQTFKWRATLSRHLTIDH